MEPVTLSSKNSVGHLSGEQYRGFVDEYKQILVPVSNGVSTLISLIPLTPVGLSAQWFCSPKQWCELRCLCLRNPVEISSEDAILANLSNQLYDAELEIANSLTKSPSHRTVARNAFNPVRVSGDKKPLAFHHSILLRCVADRLLYTQSIDRHPFPTRTPCLQELPLGKYMDIFVGQLKAWPSVMKSFSDCYCALPAQRLACDRQSVIESLVRGLSETEHSARMAVVENNFCAAALGLMAVIMKGVANDVSKHEVLGQLMLRTLGTQDKGSRDTLTEGTRNALTAIPNNDLLRALHLAVVVSPVCLFGECVVGPTAKSRVTQASLVDYFVHTDVDRDDSLQSIERLGFQLIIDMVIGGRDCFRIRLPHLIDVLKDMGVDKPQFVEREPAGRSPADWSLAARMFNSSDSLKSKCARLMQHIGSFTGPLSSCPVDINRKNWLTDALLTYDQVMERFVSVPPTPVTPHTPPNQVAVPNALAPDYTLCSSGSTLTGASVSYACGKSIMFDRPVQTADTSLPHMLDSPINLKRCLEPTMVREKSKRAKAVELPLVQTHLDLHDSSFEVEVYLRKRSAPEAHSPTDWNCETMWVHEWEGLEREQDLLRNANCGQLHPVRYTAVKPFCRVIWQTSSEHDQRRAFATSCVHAKGDDIQKPDTQEQAIELGDVVLRVPAPRITSWMAIDAIRSVVDDTAYRIVYDVSSARSAVSPCRMSVGQFVENVCAKVLQAIVFEEHPVSVDHLTPFLENVDDSSRYIGDELGWATRLDYRLMMPRWMSLTSDGITSSPVIASSGLCVLISIILGGMQVYIAHGEPSVGGNGWSIEKWEAISLCAGEWLYIKPNTVYFTVSLRDSLLLGARFYCADTLSSTLSAVVREHFFGSAVTKSDVYPESLLMLFSLLNSWASSTKVRMPAWREVASLFVFVVHSDQLAPSSVDAKTVWQSTPEFQIDFKKAHQLLDRIWQGMRCPDFYIALGDVRSTFAQTCKEHLQRRGRLELEVHVHQVTDRFSLFGR